MSRIAILATAAFGFLLAGLPVEPSLASQEIAAKEGLDCTSCHRKPSGRKLNDRGKFYELVRSMEGYDELEERFERCTTCHARKAGSKKLTREGERYRWMMQDMEGIRLWLMSRHPKPPVMDPPPTEEESPERHGAAP